MQIREQGRKIQCIRTVYDKAIGRGRQVVVATLPRWSTSLMPSEDGLAQLTDAEREQLEAFLAQRRADAEESNSRYTAMSAASWLATLAKSIKEGQQLRPEQADAIWQGMTEVAKSLRKAGYAKPKISRKAKAVPTPQAPQEATAGEGSTPGTAEVTNTRTKPARKPRAPKAATSTDTMEGGQG
ncbi:hypothetical protein [Pseudochelatococcus contaminans]|uniref:Uncharacterized protein n=1 Tax=Pseudochelatococcus contaminans TaxID=1538103 RepID=A0A7W5Z8I5_9HYPH|nr:hypothetical protein [Pseudochelatococcus contaminans]MBB3811584.1 hypothetical protein [Pseudochelatococcus contaminans]